MAVINTNISALMGQQNLKSSQSALQTSMERLSSGLRINSAADDAAGEAIANRMTAQVNGLSQAQRNANDGISVAQTAEGALNQVNDNLQRIRKLTVQAQNGTNSQSDLQSIQNEIDQRLEEINRVSDQTSFNGVKVLAKDQTLQIQVGANDGEQIGIKLNKINADTLKLGDFNVAAGLEASNVAASTVSKMAGDSVAIQTPSFTAPGSADGSFASIQTDGSNFFVKYAGDTKTSVNGYYKVTVDNSGNATLGALTSAGSAPSAADLSAASAVATSVTLQGDDAGNVHAYNGGSNAPSYVIQVGSGSQAQYFSAEVDDEGNVTRGAEYASKPATDNPLAALDSALNQVDDLRSGLGAAQNRFDSAITNLGTTTTNLTAARSRIEDADYGKEVSAMTRAQILQQAGTSVLAQANQAPQNVLALLR